MSDEPNRFTCAICLGYLSVPKLLACGHSFCRKCLYATVKHAITSKLLPFKCPTCRATMPKLTFKKPEDVDLLPTNMFVTPMDIERSLLATNSTCPKHKDNFLISLCLDCDTFVCCTCRMIGHMDHKTKSLLMNGNSDDKKTEPEDKEKGKEVQLDSEEYVDGLVKELEARLDEAKETRKAILAKRGIIEQQVRSRARLLRDLVEKESKAALTTLRTVSAPDERQTKADIDNITTLLKAIKRKAETPLDAETLEEARQASQKRSKVLCHLSLAVSSQSLDLQRIPDFLGCPAAGFVDSLIPAVTMETLFTVGQDLPRVANGEGVGFDGVAIGGSEKKEWRRAGGSNMRVECVCPLDRVGLVWVVYTQCCLKDKGKTVVLMASYSNTGQLSGRVTETTRGVALTTFRGRLQTYSPGDTSTVYTRGYSRFKLQTNRPSGRSTVYEQMMQPCMFSSRVLATIVDCRMHSFDCSPDGESIVVVAETGESPQLSAVRTGRPRDVVLFRRSEPFPVAVYHPPNADTFSPADVCFYSYAGVGVVLLVADWAADQIHVVRVEEERLTFARFLLDANCPLVKPTFLVPDCRGRLLVGCGGGQVVQLTRVKDASEVKDAPEVVNATTGSSV